MGALAVRSQWAPESSSVFGKHSQELGANGALPDDEGEPANMDKLYKPHDFIQLPACHHHLHSFQPSNVLVPTTATSVIRSSKNLWKNGTNFIHYSLCHKYLKPKKDLSKANCKLNTL